VKRIRSSCTTPSSCLTTTATYVSGSSDLVFANATRVIRLTNSNYYTYYGPIGSLIYIYDIPLDSATVTGGGIPAGASLTYGDILAVYMNGFTSYSCYDSSGGLTFASSTTSSNVPTTSQPSADFTKYTVSNIQPCIKFRTIDKQTCPTITSISGINSYGTCVSGTYGVGEQCYTSCASSYEMISQTPYTCTQNTVTNALSFTGGSTSCVAGKGSLSAASGSTLAVDTTASAYDSSDGITISSTTWTIEGVGNVSSISVRYVSGPASGSNTYPLRVTLLRQGSGAYTTVPSVAYVKDYSFTNATRTYYENGALVYQYVFPSAFRSTEAGYLAVSFSIASGRVGLCSNNGYATYIQGSFRSTDDTYFSRYTTAGRGPCVRYANSLDPTCYAPSMISNGQAGTCVSGRLVEGATCDFCNKTFCSVFR
jgi:hypothetical protein